MLQMLQGSMLQSLEMSLLQMLQGSMLQQLIQIQVRKWLKCPHPGPMPTAR